MGSAIARRMAENGARVLTSLKGRSQATVDRALQAGMISASDEEIAAHAELVMSVVPPGEALALAERLQPVFERQSRRPIFMDCNAVNPSTLDRIRAAIGQDEHFLDTCIIGSPPKPGGPSPTLYVCGPSSAQAMSLRDLGLEVRLLPGPLGRASGLKMCYGGITKGLIAIGAAMARVAQRDGLADVLADELEASAPGIAKRLRSALPDMPSKAYRWVAEMRLCRTKAGGRDFPRGSRILLGGGRSDRGIQRCAVVFPGPSTLGLKLDPRRLWMRFAPRWDPVA
jgi:3-hydroxyisobutyrate dehydrogenase-like beta-hydroxyacid dehydrogenase